jgi:hypothetical protein
MAAFRAGAMGAASGELTIRFWGGRPVMGSGTRLRVRLCWVKAASGVGGRRSALMSVAHATLHQTLQLGHPPTR